MSYTLSDIYIYPVKSLSGIRLSEAPVLEKGLQYDRRWMLTDPNGTFMTARSFPQMLLLDVAITPEGLQISQRTGRLSPLLVPFTPPTVQPVSVTVWDDTPQALPVGKEADAWFTEALGKPCRMVFTPEHFVRRVDPNYVAEELHTSFSDAYPLLVIGQASFEHLNTKLEKPVPMERFRPNVVFTGGAPHEEDSWRDFRIGSVAFRGVKLCARCVLTTIDPQTAQKGAEPLRTLATYRQRANKILFGQNLVALSTGTIRVGDLIEVMD